MKLEIIVPDDWAKVFTEREVLEIVTNALGDAWQRANGVSDYERENHNLLSSKSFVRRISKELKDDVQPFAEAVDEFVDRENRRALSGMTNPRDEEELDN